MRRAIYEAFGGFSVNGMHRTGFYFSVTFFIDVMPGLFNRRHDNSIGLQT